MRHIWLTAAATISIAACGSDTASASHNGAPANIAAASGNGPAAAAPAPQGPLPPEIIRWGQSQRRNCAEAHGRASGSPRISASADFNGDGRPDYFVSAAESFQCAGQDLGYVYHDGPQGASLWDFFLSTPRGYRLIEGVISSMQVEEIRISQFENKPVAMLTTDGPGAYERPFQTYAFGWNGREMGGIAFFIDGRRVNEDGTRFGGGGWVPAPFPEIPQGFFSSGVCWETARTDVDGEAYLYLTNRSWRQWDATSPIVRVERNGPVRYRFHITVEDEAGNRSPSVIDIMTVNAADFVVLNHGRGEDQNFSHCEPNEVPARLRSEWVGR